MSNHHALIATVSSRQSASAKTRFHGTLGGAETRKISSWNKRGENKKERGAPRLITPCRVGRGPVSAPFNHASACPRLADEITRNLNTLRWLRHRSKGMEILRPRQRNDRLPRRTFRVRVLQSRAPPEAAWLTSPVPRGAAPAPSAAGRSRNFVAARPRCGNFTGDEFAKPPGPRPRG
jgi:hypothetical protein